MTLSDLENEAASALRRECGAAPSAVASAPGRVNLIGEHVDYNAGIVLPMPLGQGIAVAMRTRPDRKVRVVSSVLGSSPEVDLGEGAAADPAARYPVAAARALAERGVDVPGFDLAIASDLPAGAGLSSSAALLVAALRALDAALGLALPQREIAEIAHRAETGFVGVECGTMDPMACAVARAGHALLLDCRSGEVEHVPLPLDRISILVADTATRRELRSSAYNDRVRECAEAVAALAAASAAGGRTPPIASLREATEADLTRARAGMSDVAFRRAGHVIREIARVPDFRDALARGDFAQAGELLDASHVDLRDAYEVSSQALDALQAALRSARGCLGARMTGAGFGGCLVALVVRGCEDEVIAASGTAYLKRTGRDARFIRP